MGSLPRNGCISLILQIVPIDDLWRPTIRLRIEIGFRWVRQAEAEALNLAYVFSCRVSDKSVELGLYHLRLLLGKEKTLPHTGQRENHTAPDRGTPNENSPHQRAV